MRDKVNAGMRFGKLVVVSFVGTERSPGDRRLRARWMCQCDCGNETKVRGDVLTRSGGTQSCGCIAGDIARARMVTTPPRRTHGEAYKNKTPEYRAWTAMINRCENETDENFPLYGGKGIKVCDRWRRGETTISGYEAFLSDMGRRPTTLHSLDREDGDGDYEPSNARWADKKQQARNTSRNIWIEYKGERMILIEASERYGIRYGTLLARIRAGWPVQRAIETAVS